MLKYFIWPLWCSFKMRRVANGRRSHANRRPARTHSCQSFCGPFSMPLIFKEYNRTFISDIWLSIRYKNMPPAMSRRRLNAKEKEKKCFGASKYVSTNWLIILKQSTISITELVSNSRIWLGSFVGSGDLFGWKPRPSLTGPFAESCLPELRKR